VRVVNIPNEDPFIIYAENPAGYPRVSRIAIPRARRIRPPRVDGDHALRSHKVNRFKPPQ